MKTTKIILLALTILLSNIFLLTSPALSETDNETSVSGTHKNVVCPPNYQSAPSTESQTTCVRTSYVCDPTNSLQGPQTARSSVTHSLYVWQCLQYIKGLPLNGKTSCQAVRANSFRKSDCFIVVQHESETQTKEPVSCSIVGYERFQCAFPNTGLSQWVPTINITNSDPYDPELIQSSCISYDAYRRPVQATAVYIEAFDTMCRAAKTDGVTFSVTSSYRTFTQQENLYYIYGATRALPPEESLHTQGLAIDISRQSWEWLHQIIGCKNTESDIFFYLSAPISYKTYVAECSENPLIFPVKRSQLYGLSPLCEDLQTDVQWNQTSIIRCIGYQKSGLRHEPWHFELDSTFKIIG